VSIFSSNVFAVKYKRNPIAHDPQKDSFFSGTDNKLAEKEQGPQKAIVKVGECLKYLKEGENFWTKYETEVLKVEEIGAVNLKVRKILFVNPRSDKWAFDESAFTLKFPEQVNYELMPCPDDKYKLSYEEVELIKKK
jgi:hypothetical protein